METPVDVPKELGEIGISCVSLEDCAGCEEPCDDLGSFPSKMDIDDVSQLFGTAKPYRRQVSWTIGLAHAFIDCSGVLARSDASGALACRRSSSQQGNLTGRTK